MNEPNDSSFLVLLVVFAVIALVAVAVRRYFCPACESPRARIRTVRQITWQTDPVDESSDIPVWLCRRQKKCPKCGHARYVGKAWYLPLSEGEVAASLAREGGLSPQV